MRTISLQLLALSLTLVAVPAMADVYNNGPIDGTTDAWTINSGFVVSDTFTVTGFIGANLTGLVFESWMLPGDVLTSAEVSATSQENGGTSLFDQVVAFTQSNCSSNQYGFEVCTESGSFNTFLSPGLYWLNMQNAIVANGDPVYWDENSGPSDASQNEVGTINSESFTILGNDIATGGTTPEPSSIVLLGSGVLSLAGVLRRKLF